MWSLPSCSPYPPSFSPHPTPKLPPFYFPIILHINICTILLFKHTLFLNCILPFHAPCSSIFAFVWGTTYDCFLLLTPFPTFTHYILLFSHTPHPLNDLSYSLAPACLPSYPPILNVQTHFWTLSVFISIIIYAYMYICNC
jgi:hypothetical protein